MRLQYGNVKAQLARFAGAGMSPNDPRVKERTNLAQEILYKEADFVGLTALYDFCSENTDCLTLPSELETLLAYNINNCATGMIRSNYFRFNSDALLVNGNCVNQGNGQLSWNWAQDAIDFGYVASFHDVCDPSFIKVYADLPEDAGIETLIKGRDENGNEVFTNHAGGWVNGEYVAIDNATPAQSNSQFLGSLFSITKPVTNGPIRYYAVNALTSVQSLIAVLQSYEQMGQFRRYRVPGLKFLRSSTNTPNLIKTICRRAMRPIVLDTDELLIQDLRAMQYELKSIQFFDQDIVDKGEQYHQKALEQLKRQLGSFYGKGLKTNMQIQRTGFMNSGRSMI